jgi:rod shape-determining protein MreC
VRNILLFIRRFSNFFFFLVLQIIALSFLFRFNKFHEAVFMNAAGEVTGRFSARYNTVEYYFHLKKTNADLVKENAHLRNLLRQNYQGPDSMQKLVVDSIKVDSLLKLQRFKYYPAKVVNSFINMQDNYITIHRGSNQDLIPHKDWGVIGPEGIVGRIISVGSNFSMVMSALHQNFHISSILKKGGETGSVSWDGSDPRFLTMINIPKSAQVAVGDTVLTSNVSDIYPAGIMVGTVAFVDDNKSSNFYKLKVKTATNFSTLQYVYVIEDLQKDEQKKIEEPFKKNP